MFIRALSIAAAFSAVAASAFAQQDSNPPWFPSLMAFEHYDSARTHLFEQARFGGSFDGNNQVTVRTAPTVYPTGYNMVYLNPYDVFLYGGGYGNIPNAIGAFVSKVNPVTLQPIWSRQLIKTAETGEWDYPGVLSILNNGLLYVIYGYRLAVLNPINGKIIKGPMELPTGEALPENTSYNGFDALPNGILIAKTTFRQEGCTEQGPPALFKCQNPADVPASILVSINPRTLQVRDQVTLPSFVSGRVTTARFQGHDYVYLATAQPTTQPPPPDYQGAIRYLVDKDGTFTLDGSWNPGNIYQNGQTIGSAVVVMNDWFVVQTNSAKAQMPLSVIAINQADATQQFSAQPFANFTVPDYGYTSWAPFSVSVDPDHNLIYAADAAPGVVGALELTTDSLKTLWTAPQRTTEFLALIGPPNRRVVVGTDIGDQIPAMNNTDDVVWRDAQTGDELARAPDLPAITLGTMVQPYYFGKIFYPGYDYGDLLELTVRKR